MTLLILGLALMLALIAGGIHAARGSALFSSLFGTSRPIKLGLIPIYLFWSAWYLKAGWITALYFPLPYLWKMLTGTGGDMQAIKSPSCNIANCQEWIVIDRLCEWLALQAGRIKALSWNYCERWGFFYCLFTGFFFTLPFLATNYWVSLPLLSYPLIVRYAPSWRMVEFGYMALYSFLFLISIWI